MKKLYDCWVLLDDTTMLPFLPFHVISEEWLRNYMKKNPFPNSNEYNSKNLFNDFMGTDHGVFMFFDLNEEQQEWIEECCNNM